MAKRIRVNLEVKDEGSAKVKRFTQTADTSFKKLKRSTDRANANFAKTIRSLKVMAVAAAAVGVAIAIKIGKDAVKAASNLEQVVGKFSVVFKDQGKKAEQFSRKLIKSYGLSERAAKQYLSSVQDLLKPMGMASDAAAEMSNKVVKLAVDLSSFGKAGTTVESVIDDMNSALVGNFETMKKHGVILNEAVVKNEAYNLGLAEQGEVLTANEKAQAAYSLIVKGSEDAVGDLARTSGSYENQIKQLKSNIETFLAMLGKEFLPKLADTAKAFNDWFKATRDLIEEDITTWARRALAVIKALGKSALYLANQLGRVYDYLFEDPTTTLNKVREAQEAINKLLKEEAGLMKQARGTISDEKRNQLIKEREELAKQIIEINKMNAGHDLLNEQGQQRLQLYRPTEALLARMADLQKQIGDNSRAELNTLITKNQARQQSWRNRLKNLRDEKDIKTKIDGIGDDEDVDGKPDKGVIPVLTPEEKAAMEERKDLVAEFGEVYKQSVMTSYAYEISQIEEAATKYKEAGADKVRVAEWAQQEIDVINEQATLDFKEEMDARTRIVQNWFQKWVDSAELFGVAVSDIGAYAVDTFASGFVDAVADADEDFGEFAKNFLVNIAKMIAQTIILNSLNKLFGFGAGGVVSDTGSANQDLSASGFASGGVVSKPTLFKFAGGTGLMGEAGAEAIMPLKRGPSGNLGVEANGGIQPQQVNYNIKIDTLDPIAYEDFVKRNPNAIIGVFNQELERGNASLNQNIRKVGR